MLSSDPNLARQHPADYVRGAEVTIRRALGQAKRTVKGFRAENVIGIGVDTTGSTPLPVNRDGRPLAFEKRFSRNPAAMAWLWKDHTGVAEAEEITSLAAKMRPQYLAKCGGTYSSEWFFSKILHCLRTSPDIFDAACPHCGAPVEFFKDDRKRKCPSCENPLVNPKLDLGCLEWCQHADKCQALLEKQRGAKEVLE